MDFLCFLTNSIVDQMVSRLLIRDMGTKFRYHDKNNHLIPNGKAMGDIKSNVLIIIIDNRRGLGTTLCPRYKGTIAYIY